MNNFLYNQKTRTGITHLWRWGETHLIIEGPQEAHLLPQHLHIGLQVSLAQIGAVFVLVETHRRGSHRVIQCPGTLHSTGGLMPSLAQPAPSHEHQGEHLV